jgi:PAS domain S-box-containing protein
MKPEDRHFLIARSLFREANDAFLLFDPKSLVVVDVNPAAIRMIGLEKQVILSMGLAELFSTRNSGGLERLAQALERTGFFHSREGYFLMRSQGDSLPVNLSVSRIHLEPDTLGLVVARDISEHRRTEEVLRLTEARYNSLVELTGILVWEIDTEGRFRSISPAFDEITGWSRNEWIGRRFDELVHPEDRAEALRLHGKIVSGHALPRFELRLQGNNGKTVYGEFLLVTRIRTDGDERILGIARDTTEQRRVQQALEQSAALERAKEAAEQANHAKSEFLSNVSHDLRTPLSAIMGFAELMSEHPYLLAAPAEVQEFLEIIRGNSRVLLSLIDDLLDISRIEVGHLHVERGPCALHQLVSNVVESFRTRILDRPVRIEVGLSRSVPPTLLLDQLRIKQILMNLLENAVKFTDRGGIAVSAELINGPDRDPLLRITVSDSGIGMSEEELARLFQPFVRVRRSGSPGAAGTGLGLSICKRLASRMGGDLTATSELGVGSVFTLDIPVSKPEEATRSVPEAQPDGPGPDPSSPAPWHAGARVLLAEDHEANRQVISTRLSQAGCEVIQARNGKEALEQIRDSVDRGQPISAVIMDMEMPVLDGYEAVRQLRGNGFTAPILAVTAFAMDQDREECLGLGCDEHISKPVDWKVLFGKLGRLLAESRKGEGIAASEAPGP